MLQPGCALVVVGNRAAAIDAVCRYYPRVVQVGGPTRRAATHDNLRTIEWSGEDAAALARVAADIARTVEPLAVVALTEASVRPAAALREALGLPGLSLDAALRCTDKAVMKRHVRAAGIPCADFVTAKDERGSDAIIQRLGLPLVLKDRSGSGGRAVQVIGTPAQMPARLEAGQMAEAFVRGPEMSVECFVAGGEPVFVNFTEYAEPRWANVVPARDDGLPLEALQALNRAAISALGIERGMTHMEVFLTQAGPVFGEIAARPPGGRIMELLELAYGFDPWQTLFALEAGAGAGPEARALRVAGVRLVHPGAGTVVRIDGRDAVERQRGLVRLHCGARPGRRLAPREGVGQAAAYALFAGDRATVEAGLACVRDRFSIVLA